tara:strand:- start:193 stop:849 length:657 start_codon:yes stop_codon:yes gene_type:complete
MDSIILDENFNNETLDTSWIEFENKIENIHEHYVREPPQEIDIFCIYVNLDSSIEYVINEKEELSFIDKEKKTRGIHKERLLQLIQKKKMHYANRSKKCKLMDILFYNADIESVDLEQDYMNDSNEQDIYSSFFKVIPIFNEIVVQDSIFVFHDVNSIFFIFKEMESHNTSLKSILKSNDTNTRAKSTKKVHIDVSRNKEFSNKSLKLKHRRKMTRRK